MPVRYASGMSIEQLLRILLPQLPVLSVVQSIYIFVASQLPSADYFVEYRDDFVDLYVAEAHLLDKFLWLDQ